ncbi:MAG: DUF2071 domain-containing protein [Ottowia sp.]
MLVPPFSAGPEMAEPVPASRPRPRGQTLGMGAGRPMRMSWHDLLFAHAPVPVAALRAVVPAGLELDTFDGVAWLGVVPFRMTRVGPRDGCRRCPGSHAFPELNVRTYVTRGGRPGRLVLQPRRRRTGIAVCDRPRGSSTCRTSTPR